MKDIKDWIFSIVVAIIIVIPVSLFSRPTIVSGLSMQPTLEDKDIVVTERDIKDLRSGDVIVFDGRPKETRGLLIKRVIGLPGDTVEIKNGFVYVNGEKIEEPYLKKNTVTKPSMELTVPEGYIFVLGDNREISEDSRYLGAIPIEKIKGHAYYRIFPFNQMGKL